MFFVTDVLYNCLSDFKTKCTNVWRKQSLWEIVIKHSETALAHLTVVTLTFDPVTLKWKEFICYPGWICEPRLRTVGQCVLELLIETVLAHLTSVTFDHVTPMSYWSEMKMLQTDGSTDSPTDRHVQTNMPSFLQKGHTYAIVLYSIKSEIMFVHTRYK